MQSLHAYNVHISYLLSFLHRLSQNTKACLVLTLFFHHTSNQYLSEYIIPIAFKSAPTVEGVTFIASPKSLYLDR